MNPIKVLYLEDDPFDADLTRRELQRLAPHIHLEVANSIRQAWECMGERESLSYDLILLDHHLPDGDGLSMLVEIRRRQLPVAVVMVTGQGSEEIAVAALKAGAEDYIVKHEGYLQRLPLVLEEALEHLRTAEERWARPLRVLYAEHNAADIDQTLRHFATHAPYIHLDIVHSGEEVLQRFSSKDTAEAYDVLLLDYRLPGKDALEVFKILRKELEVSLPVVLVTGRGDEETAVRALKLGVANYVTKARGYLYQLPAVLESAYHHTLLEREHAALKTSEERLRRLFENAQDVIYRYRIKPELALEYINPAVLKVTGYTPEEYYANPLLVLEIAHPGDRPLLERAFQGSPPTIPILLRWLSKDGRIVWTEHRITPIYDAEGTLMAIEGISRDVTQTKELEARTQQQYQRLEALRKVDLAITASLDIRLILDILLDQVLAQLRVDAASVMLLSPQTHYLETAARRGFHTGALRSARIRLGEGYAGKAALERRIIYVPDLVKATEDEKEVRLLAQEGFISYYAVPLTAKGRATGVMELFCRAFHQPEREWMEFLEALAGQAAIAIDNSRMFEEIQRVNLSLTLAYDRTIEGWARALEIRDRETEGHTRRVTDLTLRLAKAMGLPDSAMPHIRRGCILHDIGKMGIPDAILLKPGPLTPQEWEVMRQHPVIAYEWLQPIDFLRDALEIPYYHHEKWDGSGYPQGLKGEEIPLAARLFAIVDVWDALTSDRPYRPAWSKEDALAYIREQSGVHFDPHVVEAFLKVLAEWEKEQSAS